MLPAILVLVPLAIAMFIYTEKLSKFGEKIALGLLALVVLVVIVLMSR